MSKEQDHKKVQHDKATRNKVLHDKATRGKAQHDKATRGKAQHDKATRGKAQHDEAMRGKVLHDDKEQQYEAVIGLEVHAQLQTQTKAFCPCPTTYGAPANTQICPVCTGLPGALPVLNEEAVRLATLASLALSCQVRSRSIFARKHYFYPDLPKGYQISQYEHPLAEEGYLTIDEGAASQKIGITRLHLEEDAGKSLHQEERGISLIDLNRCGVPLVEIVSAPQMRSPREAGLYLRALHEILVYLDVCSGNMEQGAFRCDANVSVRRRGDPTLGRRTELKNLNSFRFIEDALRFEIARQIDLLEQGQQVEQQTLLWDVARGVTVPLRSKEESSDYRYFPEPDLPPLDLDPAWIQKIASSLPELPQARRQRLVAQYNLPPAEVAILCQQRPLADYFEECAALAPSPHEASNWIRRDLLAALRQHRISLDDCRLHPRELASLLQLLDQGAINTEQARQIFSHLFLHGGSAADAQQLLGLSLLDDETLLQQAINAVFAAHPRQLQQYRQGEEKLFGFFMGQLRQQTQGRANMKRLQQLLRQRLLQ